MQVRSSLRWSVAVVTVAVLALVGWLALGRPGSDAPGDTVATTQRATAVQTTTPRPRDLGEIGGELSLRLLATTTGRDPSRARAHIEDTLAEARFVLGNGESVPERQDTVVSRIDPGRVLLEHDGRTVTLVLDPKARLSDSLESPTIEDFLAQYGGGDEEELLVGIKALHALKVGARDREALYDQARFAPNRDESGEMDGLLVTGVAAGGFFDQLGLEEDDVLLEVNGVVLDSPQATAGVWPELETETSIRVVVRGPNGAPVTLESHTVRPD